MNEDVRKLIAYRLDQAEETIANGEAFLQRARRTFADWERQGAEGNRHPHSVSDRSAPTQPVDQSHADAAEHDGTGSGNDPVFCDV